MLPNIVLFEGMDANPRVDLWETDGTAAGTYELTTSGKYVPGTSPRLPGRRSMDSCPNLRGLWT